MKNLGSKLLLCVGLGLALTGCASYYGGYPYNRYPYSSGYPYSSRSSNYYYSHPSYSYPSYSGSTYGYPHSTYGSGYYYPRQNYNNYNHYYRYDDDRDDHYRHDHRHNYDGGGNHENQVGKATRLRKKAQIDRSIQLQQRFDNSSRLRQLQQRNPYDKDDYKWRGQRNRYNGGGNRDDQVGKAIQLKKQAQVNQNPPLQQKLNNISRFRQAQQQNFEADDSKIQNKVKSRIANLRAKQRKNAR
jgi:hypothetical protein